MEREDLILVLVVAAMFCIGCGTIFAMTMHRCAECDLCAQGLSHDGGDACREKRMEYHGTVGGYDICFMKSPVRIETFPSSG